VRPFVRACVDSGVDGVIVPDLPPEEAQDMRNACVAAGLDLVFLLAPNSTPATIGIVGRASSGFIYCVSVAGVTGSRKVLSSGLASFVRRVREKTSLPLAVGFDVSSPEQVASVAAIADGVIVGSALIESIERMPAPERSGSLERLMQELARSTRRRPRGTGHG
jgi:tryptophan synthase alpha chain